MSDLTTTDSLKRIFDEYPDALMEHRMPLTKRQMEYYRMIKDWIQKNGYSPSLKEIAKAMGSDNTSTAQYFIKELIDCSWIRRDGWKLILTNYKLYES